MGFAITIAIMVHAEFTPVDFRALYMTYVGAGKHLSGVVVVIICMAYVPNFEASGFQMSTFSLAVIQSVLLLIYCFVCSDSPRHLLSIGDTKKAIEVMESIANGQFDDEVKKQIVEEAEESERKGNYDDSFSRIFSKNYLRTTICLIIIKTSTVTILYGTYLILTVTLAKLLGKEVDVKADQIYKENLLILLVGIIALFIAGGLAEIKSIGRKFTLIISYSFSAIGAFGAAYFPNWFIIFFGIFLFGVFISYIIQSLYSNEIYPTSIRNKAIGLLVFIMRFGAAFSQFIYYELSEWDTMSPYYFTGILCLINVLTAMLLDKESHGVELDCDEPEQVELIKEEKQI